MMWAKLAGDRDSARPRVPQQSDAATGAEVLTMDPGIAELGEKNISSDDDFLRSARPASQAENGAPVSLVHHPAPDHVVILAMIHHGEIEHPRILHCPSHHFMILDAVAVVRDGHDSCLNHRPDRSHLFTVQSLGDCAGWEDVDRSAFADTIRDPGDGTRAVGWRIGVWHADD